jgi:hypothetical protein
MACKIAIMAKDSGRFFAGDCVEAHKVSVYMGGSVEPVGGDLRVLDVTNAYRYDELIVKLTNDWMINNPDWIAADTNSEKTIPHPTHNRQFYLEPVTIDNPYYEKFRVDGRISVTIEQVEFYVRERNG